MRRAVLVPAVLVLAAAILLMAASFEDGGRSTLVAGLLEPVFGLNHFMILVGVGLWAGRWGGRALWALPAAFLLGTPVGYMLAAGQPPLPLIHDLVHVLIVGSLLLIAGVLAFPLQIPLREAASTVAMFGGCHGYVHGLEAGRGMPQWFEIGAFTMAVALLAIGVLVGASAPQRRGPS